MKKERKSSKGLKFKQYVFGLVFALELIMSFTFLGYIHIPPISITTAYIPIVIAACLLGPLESTLIGLTFGLGSMYKASALYVVSVDRIFSPAHSGNPLGSILLSVGTRVLFGFVVGVLFMLIKNRKHIYLWNAVISAISPLIHSMMVYTAMEIFFPEYGFTYKNAGQFKISDGIVMLFCVLCVELLYLFYHSEFVKKYENAIDYTNENPYFSKKIGVRLFFVEIVIIYMAVISTVYFSNRAEYMLKEHGIEVTRNISNDLLHLQIQFLVAMLALDLILILLLLVGYRYMAYREYRGEMDHLTGIMGRRLFLYYCNQSQEETSADEKGWFLFLDVDWFKEINDNFGHTVGDYTLKQIARILKNTFGEYGAVGRVGGDEFAVLINRDMEKEELEEKLDSFLADIALILSEKKVSCSIGAYHFVYPQEIKCLLEETDTVLYRAKATGRACYVIQE